VTEQWTFDGSPPADESRTAVTLVEGATFCIGRQTGDIQPGPPHGLFFRDTRILSRWEMHVDGHPLQPLLVERVDPFAATFVCQARPRSGQADATILVQRRRYIGDGMREDVVLENLSGEAAGCEVKILVDADFADLFEVKEDRVITDTRRLIGQTTDSFHAEYRRRGQSRGVRVTADPQPDYHRVASPSRSSSGSGPLGGDCRCRLPPTTSSSQPALTVQAAGSTPRTSG
jgi:hypothetical protein